MVSTLAFLVTVIVVMPHISHAQPTLPKPTQCQCRVANQSADVATNQSDDAGEPKAVDAAELRRQFLQVLQSRRSAEVPLSVEPAEHVDHPLYQNGASASDDSQKLAMQSCANGTNFTTLQDLLHEENLYLITEAGEQGRVPVLILSLKQHRPGKRPAVVFMHGTGGNKESLRPMLEAYASRGYIAVAIDSRYHGLRAKNKNTYHEALVSSWEKGDTMPFIFDTAWDLIKLADYLTQREDIDHEKIGITGISLGGMHAWFGGFAETRYSVVVPIIGVQGFRWAIDNNEWQDRVESICPVFDAARQDLNKTLIDKEVVKKVGYSSGYVNMFTSFDFFSKPEGDFLLRPQVWDRIAPGLDSTFDSPYTIPAISPRPLRILNGADDPRCPIHGLDLPVSRANETYKEANVPDNFQMTAQTGVMHALTTSMVTEACGWFDRFFKM